MANENVEEKPTSTRWQRSRQFLFIASICLGAVFLVAFIVQKGGQTQKSSAKMEPDMLGQTLNMDWLDKEGTRADEIRQKIFSAFDSERMAKTLRMLTQKPHVAGTEENRKVAEDLAKLWRQNGLENVQLLEYDVFLSYPNWTSPNHASVLNHAGRVLYKSSGLGPDLLPQDGGGNDLKASIQWLAYSANGTVQGEPVYCHYGRREDFERLEKDFGISSLEGKIALIRYGKLYRGDKVRHAEERGAVGAILFSDPAEVAWDGPEATFPKTDELPGRGAQRGALIEANGDALSPLLPARKDFHRQKTIEELKQGKALPKIPAMPMGFDDARQILSRMAGPKVPREWQGGLDIEYRVGPGFAKGRGKKLELEVQSTLEVKTIQNVIGIIRGSEEPDSWVMLGNHFDAWVFGSIDPNSGTAILAEVGRTFAELVRTSGWRPKRTLVFCAWDGEEHALIGSTEFVQEFATLLQDRAIVYLNLDLLSANQTLDVLTVPSLYHAVAEAAKVVPNPNGDERAKGRLSMFDSWQAYFPPNIDWLPGMPRMGLPGGASDYMSFLNYLAIPVVDFTYRNSSWHAMNGYPLYHSRYEVPFVNEHIFDSHQLSVHKAVGQFWAEMARSFADNPVLPINATIFAQKLLLEYLAKTREAVLDLHTTFPDETAPALTQMGHLEKHCQLFLLQTRQFELDSKTASPDWANRRLRKVDQCFMNPALGMVELEADKRHVLFSLSSDDSYTTTVMAAVHQKINEMAVEEDGQSRKELGQKLAQQLAVIQYSVLCATNILKHFY